MRGGFRGHVILSSVISTRSPYIMEWILARRAYGNGELKMERIVGAVRRSSGRWRWVVARSTAEGEENEVTAR
jgi:hypothetical protein